MCASTGHWPHGFRAGNTVIDYGYGRYRKKASDRAWGAPETSRFVKSQVELPMSDTSRQMTPQEAAEFAEQVFNVARQGDAAMMAALLNKGLPPNLRNHKGDTLLMLAAYHGHVDTVKVLLEHKADPEIRNDNGQSPIAGAAFKGDLAVVTALVEGGAQVEGASFDGRTALMMAAMFNRVQIVDYLISQGADPKARDANGSSALDAARTMGAADTTAQLEKLPG
jgi:ankyrin repeat protein